MVKPPIVVRARARSDVVEWNQVLDGPSGSKRGQKTI